MYERVVVDEVSQYVVAADEKLSQGYVSKRVRRVMEWMGRVGNKEYGAAPEDEKLRYLQRFAEKKYDHYRREAEAAFRESRQDMVIIKERGTRQAAENDDEKNVGRFVGEVKIEKTIRPREGKPQFLREARLGVENLLLLACHVVARQEVPLPKEPDEEAQRKEREYIAKELAQKRILEAKVACLQQEIGMLEQKLAAARRELQSASSQAPLLGRAGEAEPPRGISCQLVPDSSTDKLAACPTEPARRLILESHDTACVPLKESELLELEKDGLKWLAEVADLIATLTPTNEYDTPYRQHLVTLWRNSQRNYHRHGIIPERQKLPRLETVRGGMPYTIAIPRDRDKFSKG